VVQGFFENTVILVLQHSEAEGTTGVILNHPMQDDAGTLEGAGGEPLAEALVSASVRLGGPVEMHSCLVGLARRPFEGSTAALPGVHWGPVLGLEGLSTNSGPAVFLGYSGWGPGQLMDELERGCWSVVSASSDLVLGAAQLGPETESRRRFGGGSGSSGDSLLLPPDIVDGGQTWSGPKPDWDGFSDGDGFMPLSALRGVWEDLHARCGLPLSGRPEEAP